MMRYNCVVPHSSYPDICRRYTEDGQTLQEIGDHYKVSRERIRQILKLHGITSRDSARLHKLTEAKRASNEAKLDRFMRGAGCTRREYLAIVAIDPRAPRAFREFLHNSRGRKLSCDMTITQWWQLWQESGHWAQRGRGEGFGVCRLDPNGPMTLSNVHISRGSDQMRRLRREMPGHFARTGA